MDGVILNIEDSSGSGSDVTVNSGPDRIFLEGIEKDEPETPSSNGKDVIDSSRSKYTFASKKSVAEGMMDIALLTANANQLRFLTTYNSESKTFYFSVSLIVLSLILQIAVGIALIFKRQMKNRGKRLEVNRTNDFLVGGVFIITVINVFVASFTTTEKHSE